MTEQTLCSLTISYIVRNAHFFLTENQVMLATMVPQRLLPRHVFTMQHTVHIAYVLSDNLKQAIRSLYFLVKIAHTETSTTVSQIPPVVSPWEEI